MIIGRDSTRVTSIDDLLDPRLIRVIDGLDLASRRLMAGTMAGERRAKRRGNSVEFDDFREYAEGDDLRHVDWNIAARHDRLVVKLFREEQDLSLHIMLDLSASMCAGVPAKSVTSARLAVALAYLALARNNRVQFTVIDGSSPHSRLAPMRGRQAIHRIAEYVIDAWPITRGTAVSRGARAGVDVALKSGPARGVTVLFSDFLDAASDPSAMKQFMRRLSRGGEQEAFAYHVLAPSELDPSLEAASGLSGDVELIEIETGRQVDATLTPLTLQRASKRARELVANVSNAARLNGVHHRLIASDADLAEVFLRVLRHDGLLA